MSKVLSYTLICTNKTNETDRMVRHMDYLYFVTVESSYLMIEPKAIVFGVKS